VISPLAEAGFGKDEIRELSRRLGLPTWNRPSSACLASRIPYGDAITPEKLKQIDSAEEFLRDSGFETCRVRHHGAIARIEIPVADFTCVIASQKKKITARFRKLGFVYTVLDLTGYRTGSMNEVLKSTDPEFPD
jgi:pyridinium-3,5-biscarboxylic acid mononucleotide sulfurtransferase